MLLGGAAVGVAATYVGARYGGLVSTGLCASGNTITIGELLDLSSDLASQGVRAKASSALAISDINKFLSSSGCNLKFANTVDDYALNNQNALTDLQSFAASGVQVVVGPLNSGAAQFILTYANNNHIVLISPSSTSVALAIPNDYLFRTAPNDRWQGQADARMMINRTATALIIVNRNDAYGNALANATSAYFKLDTTYLGGSSKGAVIDTITYDTSTTDFTTVLNKLQSDFNNNVATYGASHIAFDFISFEEFGTLILKAHSTTYPSFPWSTLPWFGTDGEAQDSVVVNATTSGPSLSQVRLPSTLYGYLNNTKTYNLYKAFAAANPSNICDAYCLGAYDDMWLAALATLQAGTYSGTAIQAIVSTVADNYFGVTGPNVLEASGDRVATTYQIWKVVTPTGGKPTWVFAGAWDAATDIVTWTSPP
jgi:branched-chain amino acid transport system substrate-binding protein